jgi:hypothetical protein
LNVELVLDRDGNTMKGTEELPCLAKVIVEVAGAIQSLLEERFG